ncbi:MAG: hypothetical protein IPM39_04255 [Chloroflexi bacterium]|nr:hypothetical protein [Chloroflexota bacterium]
MWKSDLGRPAAESLVDALVTAVQGAGTDPDAIRAAIGTAVAQTPPLVPTSTRIADRTLLRATDGSPATDAQIESGDFQIVAQVDGQPGCVVLDIEPADIVLQESS